MEPIEYIRALRARWWVVALVGLVGLVAAWVTTPARPPAFQGVTSFTGTHTLILDDPAVSQPRAVDLARAALMTKTGEVPRRVAEALKVDTKPALLATRISVRYDSEVRTVSITASGEDGSQTALLADTFAAQLVRYLDEREQDRQKRELDVVKARMDDLQRQSTELEVQIPGMPRERQALARAQVDALVRQFGVSYERFQQLAAQGPASLGLVTLEEATAIPIVAGGFRPPDSRGGRIAIAVPLALLLGAAMVLLAKRVDTRIATKGEAEHAFGLPVVAEIPRLPRSWRGPRRAVAALSATSPTAEAYRTLRSSVRLMAPLRLHPPGADAVVANGAKGKRSKGDANGRVSAEDGRVILVASPGRREGRTTVVTSLAASFARTSKRVIVLDFDRLKPEVARWLGAPGAPDGAPEPAGGGATRAEASSVPGVRVMTEWLDPGDMTEALEAGREAVTSARRQAEVVLMDTPPLLTVSDAGELVSGADAVIVVCRSGRTTAESAARASELLGRLDAAVLGVVLVGVRPSRDLPRPPRIPSRVRRTEQRRLSGRVAALSEVPSVAMAAGAPPPLAVGPAGNGHLAEPLAFSDTPDRPDQADPPQEPELAGPVEASAPPQPQPQPQAVSVSPNRPTRRMSRSRAAPVALADPPEPEAVVPVEAADPPPEPEAVVPVEAADPPPEPERVVPVEAADPEPEPFAPVVLGDPPDAPDTSESPDPSDTPAGSPARASGRVKGRLGLTRQPRG